MRHMVTHGIARVKRFFAFHANFFADVLQTRKKADILKKRNREVSGMSMGERIRRRRQELGLTVEDVGLLRGVDL